MCCLILSLLFHQKGQYFFSFREEECDCASEVHSEDCYDQEQYAIYTVFNASVATSGRNVAPSTQNPSAVNTKRIGRTRIGCTLYAIKASNRNKIPANIVRYAIPSPATPYVKPKKYTARVPNTIVHSRLLLR